MSVEKVEEKVEEKLEEKVEGVEDKGQKTGVFVCHCGRNIAATVDVPGIVKKLSEDPDLYAAEELFLCSDAGQESVRRAIREKGLENVVIASCSPVHHGTIFSNCVGQEMNKFMWEMANIREQCSWVHDDIDVGTKKAMSLIRGAISRVQRHVPIEKIEVPVIQEAMVIGGGIAGLHASLELADKGFKVHLIEKEGSIGGNMVKLDRTFPTDDCSMCTISPILNSVVSNPNIDLHTTTVVTEFGGRPGEYHVKLHKTARKVREDLCTGCGECVKVCPVVKIEHEFDHGLSLRPNIYFNSLQDVPKIPRIDTDHCIKIQTGGCGLCAKACQVNAIDYDQQDEETEMDVGAVIVATGYEQFDLSGSELNYEHPDVITGLELERMLSPSGPTEGKVTVPSTGKVPGSVTFILCAGSRDERSNAYCSKICCTYSLKNANLVLQEHPDTEVNVCYIDIRTAGRDYEEYYRKVRGKGVNFIHGRPSEILPSREGGLEMDVYDHNTSKLLQVRSDLVVLAASMRPSRGTTDMISTVHMVFGPDGFIKPMHIKIAPVDTTQAGVFIAGTCSGPKAIQECITDAGAAASRVATFLKDATMSIDLDKAIINKELCIKCGTCAEGCPYDAIDTTGEYYKVIEVSCQGCGKCAANCPTGAIDLRQFLDDQIEAQMDGILAQEPDSIIAIVCTQCGYNAADIAGTARMDYPSTVKIIRYPCTARISYQHMIYPLLKGALGVMVVGCLPEQCHYIDGNVGAKDRTQHAKLLLNLMGIGSDRLEFFNMSSAEGAKFAAAAKRMVEQCK